MSRKGTYTCIGFSNTFMMYTFKGMMSMRILIEGRSPKADPRVDETLGNATQDPGVSSRF